MMNRRRFLLMLAAALPLPREAAARFLREAVEAGSLGEIRYCRVSDRRWRRVVESGLGMRPEQRVIIDVDPRIEGAALLGARGTLVLYPRGCRRFPSTEV